MSLPQIDLLVHGFGVKYSGGKAYAYLAGTSTLATWYTDAEGTVVAANPYTLDSQGKAVLYCFDRLKIDVRTAGGVSAPGFPIDGLGFYTIVYPTNWTKATDYGADKSLTTIQAAIAAMGGNAGTLYFGPGTWTVTDNLTIPFNVTVTTDSGTVFSVTTGKTLTINGPFEAGIYQVFSGSGTVTLGFDPIFTLPEWWGAIADASHNDTEAVKAALVSGGKSIYFRSGTYMVDNLGTVPAGVTLEGAGRNVATIKKRANGDLMTLGEGVRLERLYLDGNGDNFTGRGLVIDGTDGRQSVENCRIIDFEDYCIEFVETTAGSQSTWHDCIIHRYDGLSAGKYAIKIKDEAQTGAYPRKFSAIETDGQKFIDLGGCNNVMIADCRVGSILFSANSVGVSIVGCRLGDNESTMNLAGGNNNITGCDIGPQIIVAAGTAECAISGNSFNASPGVVDNSGMGGRNRIDMIDVTYVPVWTASGSNPAVGNGLIAGYWSRSGAQIQVTITLTMGTTTTLGAGNWRFSLPITPVSQVPGVFRGLGTAIAIDNSTGTTNQGLALIVPDQSYVEIMIPGAGPQYYDVDSPWAWGDADSITISISYTV